jgi:hypothetical protein
MQNRPLGGDFCSKLRAPNRGSSLGPFVCGTNKDSAEKRPISWCSRTPRNIPVQGRIRGIKIQVGRLNLVNLNYLARAGREKRNPETREDRVNRSAQQTSNNIEA